MGLRVTLDSSMLIVAMEIFLDKGPTVECRQGAHGYQQLIGLRIGSAFYGEVKKIYFVADMALLIGQSY